MGLTPSLVEDKNYDFAGEYLTKSLRATIQLLQPTLGCTTPIRTLRGGVTFITSEKDIEVKRIREHLCDAADFVLDTVKWVDEIIVSISLFRRIAFLWALVLTSYCYYWSFLFVIESATRSGTEIALILGAILAPMSALQGYILNTYATKKDLDKYN